VYESKIVEMVASRLEMGRAQYGDFDPHGGRKWAIEALEEVIDAMVYCAGALIQLEENMSTESKQQIGAETIAALRGVLDACEAGKTHERTHRPLGSANAIREFCDLAEKVKSRISGVDGSDDREHRADLERACSTRRYWWPSNCQDTNGLSGCSFQSALAESAAKSCSRRNTVQGSPRPTRAKCHNPEAIRKRDLERIDLIIEAITAAGVPISVHKACQASGLRADVIQRLWGRGIGLTEQGLVEVLP
jgi:hypothetical protein